MGELVLWVKVGGAAVGSSIAVVFKPGGDSRFKLLARFIIGTIIGCISAPIIREHFGWGESLDHWLASATLGGLTGYLALQVFLGDDALKAVRSRLRGADSGVDK